MRTGPLPAPRRCPRRRFARRAAAAVLLLPALAAPALAAPGDTPVAFLKFDVGARAEGMGGAYVAHGGDATAMYWNPAGLVGIPGAMRADVSHMEWFQDVRYEHLSLAGKQGNQAWGIAVSGLWMDPLDKRDELGLEQGTFRAWDFSGSLGYARRLSPRLDLGAAVRLIREQIDVVTADAWAVDLGAVARTPVAGLTAGGSVANLGPKMSYGSGDWDLPRVARAGLAYRRDVGTTAVLLAWDAVFPAKDDAKNHLGAEVGLDETVFLRLGWKTGYDTEDMTFGIGLNAKHGVTVDYAQVQFDKDLGTTHRFSLSRDW